jgi:hypothetical protein
MSETRKLAAILVSDVVAIRGLRVRMKIESSLAFGPFAAT